MPLASAGPAALRRGRLIVIGFLLCGILFQFGLFFLGDTQLRLPLRVGVYGVSLAALVLVQGALRAHPAVRVLNLILCCLAVFLLNPGGGVLAAVAQLTLYLAVLAPLIWIGRLQIDLSTLRQTFLILWAFHSASAGLGVLQAKYPGQFSGSVSINYSEENKAALSIVTADGYRVLRPQGLTDMAGGAGFSGVSAAVLGLGVLLNARTLSMCVFATGSVLVSLLSIYLAQGRTNLVVVLVAVAATCVVLIKRGDRRRLWLMLTVISGVGLVGTSMALTIGGTQTLERWLSLTADDPTTIIYKNRGVFLDVMLREDMFKYPLGAGAGRWGMITQYFGDPSQSLWAEIMWQALLYDGGIILIVLYAWMLVLLVRTAWRVAVRSVDHEVGIWGTVTLAMTLTTIAASFVYPVYIKPLAIEVFVLNAALYAYVRTASGARPRPSPTFSTPNRTLATGATET